jgi:hypothetical protein
MPHSHMKPPFTLPYCTNIPCFDIVALITECSKITAQTHMRFTLFRKLFNHVLAPQLVINSRKNGEPFYE